MEVYQRRENLRFYGIRETSGTTDENIKEVHLCRMSWISVRRIPFSFKEFIELGGSTLHKICQDRLLPGFCDELIVSRANKLKGKGLGISADLPQEFVNSRRALMPKFKKTKEDGQ